MKKLNCKLGDTFGNWTVVDDNTFVIRTIYVQ